MAIVEEKQVARQVIWAKEVARSKASVSPNVGITLHVKEEGRLFPHLSKTSTKMLARFSRDLDDWMSFVHW